MNYVQPEILNGSITLQSRQTQDIYIGSYTSCNLI